RYDEVLIEATDLEGGRLRFTCTGLLSRAVQHEIDHLNGVLFVDRMEAADRERSRSFLEELEKKGASAS
ncbi:MAG: peptide deformylase, partial [Verrucomicrobiae bacterium]|nr:peptide deformylase [Verrucomicrobiae bacterium]